MSTNKSQSQQRHNDQMGKSETQTDFASSIQKCRIPQLEFNRINGETNIIQFARSLRKYSEQELPALESAVARYKAKPPV